MPKRPKAAKADFTPVETKKFRTTPVKYTITHVSSLPRSAIIYKCEASAFWQFRVFVEGQQWKRTAKLAGFSKVA